MNRAQFQELADLRVAEAEALFASGLYEGAYYLAGYSVECALKACIAKLTNQYDFPGKNTQNDCYTHDFEKLFKTATLSEKFADDRKADAVLEKNWSIVKQWKEDSRYDPKGSTTRADAEEMIRAITDAQRGVLSWVKRHW